ncbi:MAG TPA: acyltransferase [Candidatus Woesebacteria bacterium]|nr:acyltransferase [Candidatus Woesebacteria bacterium]HRT39978.1 acyltransferase [Candidatus Woesebacteria bacterium]
MMPKILNRLQTIILEFWLLILRIVGHIPSHMIRKFFYLLSGVKMNYFKSTIHIGANFFKPSGITIGQDTIIGDHCFLDGRAPLKIGNHVGIASQVLIYNDEHDINSPTYGNSFGPVEIGDYVFIGPRVIILPGVKIGRGAVIAAGAVVTKNIPDFEIWGGVPARKIADRQIKNPSYKLGRAMLFQ